MINTDRPLLFQSTRETSSTHAIKASEAIKNGLAQDGGLYVPQFFPNFSNTPNLEKLNLPELAPIILKPFFQSDFLFPYLEEICQKAFNFPVPLRKLKNSPHFVLELFHGPTCAFKDFAARFLALSLAKLYPLSSDKNHQNKMPMVLVATSGDTGSAVADAFEAFTNIPVTILFPKDKVSLRQKKQLTYFQKNTRAFEVDGTFDDCQKLVKNAFLSSQFQSSFHLISANSINLARLLPQMCYFAYASLQYFKQTQKNASFIIPSGNMGNATGAIWAKQMGFPIDRIIFAFNSNHSVTDYFQNGAWSPHPSIATLANAMDVGNPSNFERIRHLYSKLQDLKNISFAFNVTDQAIINKIKKDFHEHELWCPHSAVAASYLDSSTFPVFGNEIIVATAHPAKFESIIEPIIQDPIEIPPLLKKQIEHHHQSELIANDLSILFHQMTKKKYNL